MQSTTPQAETQKPNAMVMLEAALSELKQQIVNGDTKRIAKKAKVVERTVIRYIKEGIVSEFETGKKILDIGRAIVREREQSIQAV